MDVRQVRPMDAPLVLALALDDSARIVRGPAPLRRSSLARMFVHSVVPMALPGRTWVACNEHTSAIIQAEPRQYVLGWDITQLAVRGDAREALPPLIGAVIAHLQSRGVPRLFTRCGASGRAMLAACDFVPLAREYVLMGPELVGRQNHPLHENSRYRMPQDAWPLHQLESDTTPSLVRQMEGLTSSDWSHIRKGSRDVVIEQDGRIVAWVGWGAKLAHGIEEFGLLVHPDYRELAPDLVQHALGHATPGTRFIARVRDYRSETLQALREAGFQVVDEEILMVKHAGVEVVRAERTRLRLAHLPGLQGVNARLLPTCSASASAHQSTLQSEGSYL